jgi:hypothetical protein
MSWLDLVLFGLVALLSAFGAKRRLTGLAVGVGALVLFRLLLVVFVNSPWVGLAFALSAGVLLGLLGRSLIPQRRGSALPGTLLGGVGGFVLGLLLVFATVTSLPIERNLNDQIVYPPRLLPLSVRAAVIESRLVAVGRDILLYPLLVRDGVLEPSAVTAGLHRFFVVGEPWERR